MKMASLSYRQVIERLNWPRSVGWQGLTSTRTRGLPFRSPSGLKPNRSVELWKSNYEVLRHLKPTFLGLLSGITPRRAMTSCGLLTRSEGSVMLMSRLRIGDSNIGTLIP